MAIIKGKIEKKYPNGKRGFASMDKVKRALIASKGGRRAHELGTGHEWTAKEAQIAGRLGGAKRAQAYGNNTQ